MLGKREDNNKSGFCRKQNGEKSLKIQMGAIFTKKYLHKPAFVSHINELCYLVCNENKGPFKEYLWTIAMTGIAIWPFQIFARNQSLAFLFWT
jgi:hypothetical protein